MIRKIFGLLVVISVISIVPITDAQISEDEKTKQKPVEIVIDSVGNVHVKHFIDSSNLPKQIELVNGTVSDISVTNELGEKKQFSIIGGNNGVLILPSNEVSIIEYQLDDVLVQQGNILKWDFRYLETTSFIIPEEVDLIFANERPVYLDEKKGITCHGCQMTLEYFINEPKILQNVKWENKEFVVEIRGSSNIDKFIFDQPTKNITFDVAEEDKFVTTIIPLELLWSPYIVYLDGKQIFFHEYNNNGTHVWLNVNSNHSSEISIIGSTVVPEFPIIIPLAIGFSMMIILSITRKINLH